MAAKKKQSKKKAKKGTGKLLIGTEGGISAGRPKGAKNKTTLFKEVMKNGFEEELEKEFHAVLKAVITKAKEGDMTAAKMLIDRAVPVTKAVDINANDLGKTGGVTIHIEQLVATTGKPPETIDIEDADIIED